MLVQETKHVVKENRVLKEKLIQSQGEKRELELKLEALCEDIAEKYKNTMKETLEDNSIMRKQFGSCKQLYAEKSNELDECFAEISRLQGRIGKIARKKAKNRMLMI